MTITVSEGRPFIRDPSHNTDTRNPICAIIMAIQETMEVLMEVTITLTEKELKFLQVMIDEDKILQGKVKSLEDVIHESIEMAMFDEGEHGT